MFKSLVRIAVALERIADELADKRKRDGRRNKAKQNLGDEAHPEV